MAQPKRQSVGARWGSGELEDGAAEGAETLPYFTVNSTAVPAYDAFCSALSGSRSCRLASSLRDGPRDCQRARVLLDHVHAHGLERRALRVGGLLGRHESCVLRFARRAVHTLFARTAGVQGRPPKPSRHSGQVRLEWIALGSAGWLASARRGDV